MSYLDEIADFLAHESARYRRDVRDAAIAAFEFAKARLTGEEPKLGENRKVTVKM